MAFGFIKKIAKLISKIPKPILGLAYEAIVPTPVRKVTDKVLKVTKHVPMLGRLTTLFTRGASMNPFEKAIREIVDVVDAAITKNGNVVVELIEATVALGVAYKEINDLAPEQKFPMLKEALDNLIGDEPDAVIGPNGTIKFSIPFVGLETVSDLIISGAMEVLKAKYGTTPP